jgi:hypothetical protein
MTRPEYIVERLDRTLVEDVKRTEKVLKELGVFERLEKWLDGITPKEGEDDGRGNSDAAS